MVWILCDGRAVASAKVASTAAARRRGLLGQNRCEGALVLPGVRQVHTVGMRFAIDVAWVDRRGRVLRVGRLEPCQVSRVVWKAATVIEATAGSMERWGIVRDAHVEFVSGVDG
jgi:uncharacterized membrane protein (UPF0127 family)